MAYFSPSHLPTLFLYLSLLSTPNYRQLYDHAELLSDIYWHQITLTLLHLSDYLTSLLRSFFKPITRILLNVYLVLFCRPAGKTTSLHVFRKLNFNEACSDTVIFHPELTLIKLQHQGYEVC